MCLPHTRGDEPLEAFMGDLAALRLPHTRGDEPSSAGPISSALNRLPYTRGDEPAPYYIRRIAFAVRPTRVGMNRRHRRPFACGCSLPHTRGDEPARPRKSWKWA